MEPLFSLVLGCLLLQDPACNHMNRDLVAGPDPGQFHTVPCGGIHIKFAGFELDIPTVQCPDSGTRRLDSLWQCKGSMPGYHCDPVAFKSPFQVGDQPNPCQYNIPLSKEELQELRTHGFVTCRPLEWVDKFDWSAQLSACESGQYQSAGGSTAGVLLDRGAVLALAMSSPEDPAGSQLASLPATDPTTVPSLVASLLAQRQVPAGGRFRGVATLRWHDGPLVRDSLARLRGWYADRSVNGGSGLPMANAVLQASLDAAEDVLASAGGWEMRVAFEGVVESGRRHRIRTVRSSRGPDDEPAPLVELFWGDGWLQSWATAEGPLAHLWQGEAARSVRSGRLWFLPALGMWLQAADWLPDVAGIQWEEPVEVAGDTWEVACASADWAPRASRMVYRVDRGAGEVRELRFESADGRLLRLLRFGRFGDVHGQRRPFHITDTCFTDDGAPVVTLTVDLASAQALDTAALEASLLPEEPATGQWVLHADS